MRSQDDTRSSVHLAPWPTHDASTAEHALLEEVDAVQRAIALGRAARAASKLKLRQPLRQVIVYRRSQRGEGPRGLEAQLDAWVDDILAELSLKELDFTDEPAGLWTESLMPLLSKLGLERRTQAAVFELEHRAD